MGPESWIIDPVTCILDPVSWILDPESCILDHRSWIYDPWIGLSWLASLCQVALILPSLYTLNHHLYIYFI